MEKPTLEAFWRALMEQHSILQCTIVSDNCAILPKSSARSVINAASSSSSTSFSRWDSQPTSQKQKQQEQEDLLLEEEEEKISLFFDRFSSSDSSSLDVRRSSSSSQELSLMAPPRLPARTPSGRSLISSLDATEDWAFSDSDDDDESYDGAIDMRDASVGRIELNRSIASTLSPLGTVTPPSPSSLRLSSSAGALCHERMEDQLTMTKLVSRRFQHQNLPLFEAPSTPVGASKKETPSPIAHTKKRFQIQGMSLFETPKTSIKEGFTSDSQSASNSCPEIAS